MRGVRRARSNCSNLSRKISPCGDSGNSEIKSPSESLGTLLDVDALPAVPAPSFWFLASFFDVASAIVPAGMAARTKLHPHPLAQPPCTGVCIDFARHLRRVVALGRGCEDGDVQLKLSEG